MTHWSKIDKKTREFTDESYQPLHTPSEYLYTQRQKAKMEEKRLKKEQKEREENRRHRDMGEHRPARSL